MSRRTCEISGCGRRTVGSENGVQLCTRCMAGLVSVGLGAVRIDGTWRGVIGASYTDEQRSAFPGLGHGSIEVAP